VARSEKFSGETSIHYNDGSEEKLTSRGEFWHFEGFRNLVQAIRGEARLLCPPEVCRSHTLVINAAHESCPRIAPFPLEWIRTETAPENIPSPSPTGVFYRVQGLDALLRRACENEKLIGSLMGRSQRAVSVARLQPFSPARQRF
jgi:hypothetical protein